MLSLYLFLLCMSSVKIKVIDWLIEMNRGYLADAFIQTDLTVKIHVVNQQVMGDGVILNEV